VVKAWFHQAIADEMEDGWVGGWQCCRIPFLDQSNLPGIALLMAGFIILGNDVILVDAL
jgi:hypothetical protein